jgi:hypothetical protein
VNCIHCVAALFREEKSLPTLGTRQCGYSLCQAACESWMPPSPLFCRLARRDLGGFLLVFNFQFLFGDFFQIPISGMSHLNQVITFSIPNSEKIGHLSHASCVMCYDEQDIPVTCSFNSRHTAFFFFFYCILFWCWG